MPKASNAQHLKLKRDIELASKELTEVTGKLAVAKKEWVRGEKLSQARSKSMIESAEQRVAFIWEGMASKLKIAQSVHDILIRENIETNDKISFAKAQLMLMQGLLHDTLVRLSDMANRERGGIISSVLAAMRSNLERVIKQTDSELETLEKLRIERSHLETSISALSSQAEGFAAKVEEKERIATELESMQKELSDLDDTIREIERRDHDSGVMQIRLSKEYQEVYFNRKKE